MGFAGELPDGLEDWWTDYARSLARRGRSDDTIAVYRKSYARFWRWALDHGTEPDPAAITSRTVNTYVDQLRTEVSPATVAILWRNLRPFFTWWADEVDQPHPFNRADTPATPDNLVPVIVLDDIRNLLAVCAGKTFDDRRDNAVIRVLADCGVRLGELVGMRVHDWDRRADLIYVNGKGGPRVVPHSASTGEALARYLRARADHRSAAAPFFWLGKKGPWGISGPQQMLARRCDQAGLPRFNPHRFRHTWAHEAKAAGLSEGDLMTLAGWKTPSMAQRYGSSAAAERARNAYRRLGLGDRL